MLPFTDNLFYGALSFFLLDMGIVAAQRSGPEASRWIPDRLCRVDARL